MAKLPATIQIGVTSVAGMPQDDGGTVLHGGSIDATNTVTNAPGLALLGAGNNGTTNLPVNGSGGAQTSKGSGTFAFNMVAGAVIGKRLSTTINGVANDTLLSGGSYRLGVRSAIHYLENARVLNFSATWNYVTGAITKHGTAGDISTYIDPATAGGATAAADSAARPTRAIPGELVYTSHGMAHSGSLAVALSADYASKTG
jgi:hypothetical protein